MVWRGSRSGEGRRDTVGLGPPWLVVHQSFKFERAVTLNKKTQLPNSEGQVQELAPSNLKGCYITDKLGPLLKGHVFQLAVCLAAELQLGPNTVAL